MIDWLYVCSLYPDASLIWQFRHLSRFIVVLYLNCLCPNLAYGLQELNKTYLLTYLLTYLQPVLIYIEALCNFIHSF